MSVLLVSSASGAPGVTTLALHLAYLWPEPALLIEADFCGGDLLGRLDGLDPNRGLVSVASKMSRGIDEAVLSLNTQDIGPSVGGPTLSVIVGPPDPSTTPAIAQAWGEIISAASKARDVVVDAGRLVPGLIEAQKVLVEKADLVLVVLRPDLPGALHARALVATLRQLGTQVKLVVIGEGFPGSEMEEAVGAEVIGCLSKVPEGLFTQTGNARRSRPTGKAARGLSAAASATSNLARRIHDEMHCRADLMQAHGVTGSPDLAAALAAVQPELRVQTATAERVPTPPVLVAPLGSSASVSPVASVGSKATVASANGAAR